MTASWRNLALERDEPSVLLARSAELFDQLAHDPRPVLLWYQAASTALVMGRGQQLPARASLPVFRRDSGGGAVLLSPDLLCLDVLLPTGHPWLGQDLGAVFHPVGAAWAQALASLGVPGVTVHAHSSTARRQGDAREQLLAAVCYATLGRGEVASNGRKLVGLSQRRRRQGALVQCGLLLRWAPGQLLVALGAEPADEEILGAAVGLDALMDPPPSTQDVITAVEQHLTWV